MRAWQRAVRRVGGLFGVMVMVVTGTLATDVGVAGADNISCVQTNSVGDELHCYAVGTWSQSPWLLEVSDTTWFSHLCEKGAYYEFTLDDLWVGTSGNNFNALVELFAASGGPVSDHQSPAFQQKTPWWGWADFRYLPGQPKPVYYSHAITNFDNGLPAYGTDYDRLIQYEGGSRWGVYLAHGGVGDWTPVGSSYPNGQNGGAVQSGVEHRGVSSDTSVFWVNNKRLSWYDDTWHNGWASPTWYPWAYSNVTPSNSGYQAYLDYWNGIPAFQVTASSPNPSMTAC